MKLKPIVSTPEAALAIFRGEEVVSFVMTCLLLCSVLFFIGRGEAVQVLLFSLLAACTGAIFLRSKHLQGRIQAYRAREALASASPRELAPAPTGLGTSMLDLHETYAEREASRR